MISRVVAPIWAEMDRKLDRILRLLYVLIGTIVIVAALVIVVIPLVAAVLPVIAVHGQP